MNGLVELLDTGRRGFVVGEDGDCWKVFVEDRYEYWRKDFCVTVQC